MIGSIPAPRSLLTVCPSTFAAACLVVGCRRTFLGLLAVLSAALPTVFAALKGWTRSRGAVYLFSLMLFLPSNTDAQAQTAPEITSGGPFAVAEGTTAVAAGSGHKVDGVKPELAVTDGVSIEANRLSLNADPVLWYAMPAASWNEALPVGNGRLAGMVFGNTGRERIQLNEDTLWAGAPYQRDILGAHRHLPEIRRLLFAGRYVEAQAMVNRELFIGGRVVRAYQTLGDLWIDLGTESQAGYRRELDLETGIARTEWTRDGVAFTREVFASAPHGVLVVRIEADTPGAITGTVELTRPVDATTTAAGTELVLEGRASHGGQQLGVRFQARLRAVAEGGSVVAEGASLRLSGADAVTLILAAATDYRGTAPGPDAVRQVEAAEATGYTALREAHVADHRAIFNRVWLELGGSEWRREPTDTRLRFVRSGGEDTDLEAMYFQFGRYLLMASSRPGTMPANLQGVWNEAVKPPWNSDYHININIQMIYWPADVANLSEMQEPLWDMLDRLRERGRATARDHYGFERGFVAHHTTDAWWWTSPVGSARYGMWPSGGAWLSRHMWEAYLFNRDAAFLRERAYPVLKEAAEFFLDWLVPEPGTDLLLSGPSISPENAFRINGRRTHVTMGPAMDQQIVRDLFENVLAAAAELGIDDAFTQETAAKLTKLAGPQVGTDGRLMEWRQEELVEADPGHRHISHAFGLYPGSQFTVRGTPDLAAAVRKSIEHRVANGGGGTGWSLGWLLNMWARLEAGGKAYSTLRRLLTDMTMDNLLDLHPLLAGTRTNVFQMDGNLGGTAGIAEMLLQSHAGEIHLLPALPRQWSRGVVEGLKARGGFEVSMAWSDGALTTVSIRSRSGEECRVRVAGGEVRTLAVGMGETRWFDGQLSEVRAPQGLGAPRDVAVTGSTPTSLSLSVTWQPPLFEGRSVYGYDVQYAKRGESGFREWPHRGRAPGTTITGLERDAAWKVRVRARNASGPGAWSSAVEYTGDIVAPVIDTIELTSNPGPDATYAAGDTIEVTVTFSETIVVTGTPQLTLDVGGRDRTANYRSVTGGVVTFEYQVAAGESDPNGVSLEADSLSLNGGTIKDAADNDADLKHDAAAAGSGHKVDGVKPQLAATEGVVVNGATLTLAYNEALDESSEPPTDAFTVTGGSQTRTVAGVSVNGRVVTLTLESEVIDGQEVTMTYRVPGTSPIQDTVGNDAEALTNQEVENKTVNTNGPGLEGIEISSDPGDDETYAEGDVIAVRVRFSETVRVDTTRGTPTLNLTVGNRSKTAGARSGPESTEVVFVYEVERGEVDEDGVSIPRGRISLNGGTIRDDGNNNAALSHDGLTADSGHRVDGVEPKLQSATVHASRLALSYDEALDEDSIPSALDFTVVVAGNDRPVIQVQVVSGNAVTLRLSSPVTAGETVIVSYRPGFNPVRDQVGNAVEALTDEPALPPLTTIAATGGGTSVTEGTAVQFTLTRELPTAAALTVGISVTERGEVIETAGSYEPPEEVTFTVGDTTATLTVLTEDDEQQESDGAVIATLQPGPDYRLGQSSTRTAQVTVEDDEGGAPPGPIGPGLPPVPNPVPSAPRNLEAVGGDEQVTLFWEVPEDDGGFAITDYEYLISGTGGGWISTGSTETSHTVTELTNGRVYLFQVRAVSGAGAGNSSNRVEVTPGVGRLEFAHFANGSSITSELVLVNVFARPIRPWLYFYNREGARIAAESVVEVTEELEIAEDGSLTVQSEMQPLQALTISTHGQGEVVAGSVTVLSNGPIGGVLRFDLPGVGVAGVGAGQPLRDALFPARRQAGAISTAAAIRNLEAEELVVSCQLMQEGAVLQEVDIELKVNGQDGRFIEEVFTTTDTTDFVGMVRCTAPAGKLFVGVAVELDAGNGIFTTLPVLPVDRTVFRGGEYALDFAHFANGASITSDLVLVNVSIRPSRPAGPFTTPIPPTRPSLYFYDREGERIAAQSVVEVTGELEVTEDGSLTVQTEMQPLEAVTISTHGRGEVVAGSVRVVAEGPIGGVLRFDLPGVGVAGVGTGQPLTDALFPARRQAGGISTAAAIRNLEAEELVVSCRLMQEGEVLEEVDIELEVNGQDGRFIEEVFTRTDTSDFVGLVRCTAEGEFTGVAVELDAGNGIFTTLPVVPVPAMTSQE